MCVVRPFLLLIALTSISTEFLCQELEPRRWSHLPIGTKFIGLGTLYTFGDINFDPALLIEDTDMKSVGIAAGYIRSFDGFGKSMRIDLTLPYVQGRWEGLANTALT